MLAFVDMMQYNQGVPGSGLVLHKPDVVRYGSRELQLAKNRSLGKLNKDHLPSHKVGFCLPKVAQFSVLGHQQFHPRRWRLLQMDG